MENVYCTSYDLFCKIVGDKKQADNVSSLVKESGADCEMARVSMIARYVSGQYPGISPFIVTLTAKKLFNHFWLIV